MISFHLVTSVLGWIGTGLILLAYILLERDSIEESSHAYLGLNIMGSIGVLISAGATHAWPAAGLQIAMIAISAYGLLRKHRR